MRVPQRLHGLGLGLVALAAGPVIIVLTSSHPAPIASAAIPSRPAPGLAAPVAGIVPHGGLLLRVRVPAPAPPPAPKPATRAPAQRASTPVSVPRIAASHGSVVAIIRAAAARYGVSGDWMVRIASCESGLRPNAYNPRGPYYGLFQFLMSTFRANGGTNIWDAADQANIAAKMLAHGQAHQWGCA